MRRSALCFLAIFLSAAAGPVLAAPRQAEVLEDAALLAESRGRDTDALDLFRRAFAEAVADAARETDPDERGRALAAAEFCFEKLHAFTEETADYAATESFLRGFDTAGTGEELATLIRWARGYALFSLGRLADARALRGELGFLTDFWVLGSFANERGGGFARAEAPETAPVDLAFRTRGKDREIGWRRIAVDPIFGTVNLDAHLRPNDQCLAYAVTFLRCPGERAAVVRVGSDEAVKVFVNGAEAIARNASRPCTIDQDRALVHLRAGANRIVVKVGDETGRFGFRLRFTHPDGSPMRDLAVANEPEEVAAAEAELAAAPAAAPPETAPATTAIDFLTALDAAGRAGARDLLHLGWLHLRRQITDRHERFAMKLLERAAELDPANPHLRLAVAFAAERPDRADVEREENDRRGAIEKAIELDPGNALAWHLLAGYYTDTLPLLEKAEGCNTRALAENPLFLRARLHQIDLLERRGFRAEAEARLAVLLAEGGLADRVPLLLRRADVFLSRHLIADAITSLRLALARDFTLDDARGRLIEALKGTEELESALALFEDRIALDPQDPGALAQRALLEEGQGRLDTAEATVRRALSICPEDDGLLQQLARLLLKQDARDDAVVALKGALLVNPKLAPVRRYVEFLDPESRPFEAAFPVDLAPLLAAAAEFEDTENDPYLRVLDQRIDRVNPDGTFSSFHRLLVKILNDQGVDHYDRFSAAWYSEEQAVWYKLARVIHPNGATSDGRIVDERFVDLPRLSPGDVVHLEWRVDQLRQTFFGDCFGDTVFFADSVPTLSSEYVVIAPADKKLWFSPRNIDIEPEVTEGPGGRTRIHTFRPGRVAKIRSELLMPPPAEIYPQVRVSNIESWDAFAKWYWQLIRSQFQVNDEMRAKVAELTTGKETRYEKVRAIHDFVTTFIRYDASWEFGVHGYKPYDATAIYARKFGDCKDKAILIVTLLREIGVEAFPVLILATEQRYDQDLALPLVGSFNHCIAFVPDVDGAGRSMFLDGTAQYGSIESLPGMDRGARVVVVRPDGGEVMTTPWDKPETNGASQTIEAELRADGSGTVNAEFGFFGDAAVMIRSAFAVEGQRSLRLNMMLGNFFGKAVLGDFSFTDLTDLSRIDAGFRFTAEVPKLAERTARGLSIPAGFQQMNLSPLVASTTREYDILLGSPSRIVFTLAIRLPAAHRVVSTPEPVTLDHPWGSLTSTVEVEDGVVRVCRTIVLKGHRLPKADYAAIREFATAIDLSANEKIVVAPE
jgi:tetratricopeptide (TPR) repeat protein